MIINIRITIHWNALASCDFRSVQKLSTLINSNPFYKIMLTKILHYKNYTLHKVIISRITFTYLCNISITLILTYCSDMHFRYSIYRRHLSSTSTHHTRCQQTSIINSTSFYQSSRRLKRHRRHARHTSTESSTLSTFKIQNSQEHWLTSIDSQCSLNF